MLATPRIDDGAGGYYFSRFEPRSCRELWHYVPDGARPEVAEAHFESGGTIVPQRLTFRLTHDATPEPSVFTHLRLTNRATGEALPDYALRRNYDPATHTITFTFPGLAGA